jgi:hypothetical protein
MSHEQNAPFMSYASPERSSHSVRALASMSRRELDAFLEATARASGAVVVARTMRPKAKAFRRTPRYLLRG